jgi:hypothetical protein
MKKNENDEEIDQISTLLRLAGQSEEKIAEYKQKRKENSYPLNKK